MRRFFSLIGFLRESLSLGLAGVFLCSLGLFNSAVEAVEVSADVFFRERVEPVLERYCYECHSHAGKKAKGGLVLDSRSGWEIGGASGPAVVPGDPDGSLLIQAVRYSDLEMPPDGQLPDNVIETLIRWVSEGASDPRVSLRRAEPEAMDFERGRQHWAFRPLMDTSVPEVADVSWPRGSVDRFLLEGLEKKGIAPSGDADVFTWLRRVSFDLTGLPPSPEEIQAFARDSSEQGKARVVDRLLGSPAFGERWARHWLDLVGYADQVGTSNNVFAEHAWRYRDYVIESYNADKPFDRFIREQIAGDLMESDSVEERAAQLTATGFLVLGDVEIVEADKAKLLVDIVDQQVTKVGRAFLGLTVECARCHDHKFDPVSQRDYYALGGFFHNTSSIYKTERGVWSDINVRELPESPTAQATRLVNKEHHFTRLEVWKVEREEVRQQRDEITAALNAADVESTEKERLIVERDRMNRRLGELNRLIPHGAFFYPKVPTVHGVKDVEEPEDMRITIRGNPRALGEAVPRGFLTVLDASRPKIPNGESGRRQLADWIVGQPLVARVQVNRVWQKLFGEGLVRTVDYFGLPGDQPSHPELLDDLAAEFVRDGWSVKRLIRRLVLSRAYGMSSVHEPSSAAKDPSNRLLWRMNSSRLDAEALRDAMIAAGGRLVLKPGGPAMPLEYPENVGGLDPKDVNPRSFRFSKWRPEQSDVRTVYLPVIRHAGQPGPAKLRNVFDFAQPSEFAGKRSVTAVPTQALFLMNDGEVKRHAASIVRRLEAEVDSDGRLRTLWFIVFNRPITNEETRDARAFLESMKENAWTELCRALLASNEFLMRM